MWALRILNGPSQGSIFPLNTGVNIVGRSADCAIQIQSPGISKAHAEINVQDNNNIVLVDKNSSNGTYVNGIKISQQTVELGDQISFHDVISDIVLEKQAQHLPMSHMPLHGQAAAEGAYSSPTPPSFEVPEPPSVKKSFNAWWNNYLNKIVLPGIYKLPEWIEFRWVIGFFALGFIFLVTLLSAIPLTRILKSTVETEAMNHAESIAQALAEENRSALAEGLNTAVSVHFALFRPGVKEAFIIHSSTGRIIAPAEKFQTYPDNPFIHRARKLGKTTVEKIDSSTVGAMVPIQYFNPETSSQNIMAYSVVVFNLASLAKGKEKTISLIVQSFFIALILGCIIFFLMYKIISYPFSSLDEQLSSALKDDTVNVSTTYQFPELESLCSNINSALERVNSSQNQNSSQMAPTVDRQNEMSNLVELIGFASLCIRLDNSSIAALNQQFEEQTGLASDHLLYQLIDQITDMSLQLNLKNVVEQITQNPNQIFIDQLEFNGSPFQVTAQGVYGTDQLSYILVAFIPEEAA